MLGVFVDLSKAFDTVHHDILLTKLSYLEITGNYLKWLGYLSNRISSLKLIICYISSGATNIAEVSSGFHQADWSTTLGIVYCYPISFCFGLFVYMFIGT